jgi:hypothetical protein
MGLGWALPWPFLVGCAEAKKQVASTWHQKCSWRAADYFDDPKVIALCRAIESNDIAEIDRLVAAGADVNAQGKGKMTPLLWAYPDNRLERFKRLLEHGANPNVAIESDFNTRGGMRAGDSVTYLACKTSFLGYFEAVFSHGGDPNLGTLTKPLLVQTGEVVSFSVFTEEHRWPNRCLQKNCGNESNHCCRRIVPSPKVADRGFPTGRR